MHRLWVWLLDEKIVICLMAIILSLVAILLIHWNAEKDYTMAFIGFVGMLLGALLRGITHSPAQSDSMQNVTSETKITPKP